MWKSEEQRQGFLSRINARFATFENYRHYLKWRKDTAWSRAIERQRRRNEQKENQ